MRKLFASLFSTLSYIFVVPLAYSQTTSQSIDPCANAGIFGNICRLGGLGGGGIGAVISAFIQLFFVIAALIAVLFLIYGGVKYITSRGDKTEVEAARNHIIAAIVGLIMVFLAFFFVNFVLGFFIKDFSIRDIKLPSLTTVDCKNTLLATYTCRTTCAAGETNLGDNPTCTTAGQVCCSNPIPTPTP